MLADMPLLRYYLRHEFRAMSCRYYYYAVTPLRLITATRRFFYYMPLIDAFSMLTLYAICCCHAAVMLMAPLFLYSTPLLLRL